MNLVPKILICNKTNQFQGLKPDSDIVKFLSIYIVKDMEQGTFRIIKHRFSMDYNKDMNYPMSDLNLYVVPYLERM